MRFRNIWFAPGKQRHEVPNERHRSAAHLGRVQDSYHLPSDTPDKVDHEMLARITKGLKKDGARGCALSRRYWTPLSCFQSCTHHTRSPAPRQFVGAK
jgi:hypothetical protein